MEDQAAHPAVAPVSHVSHCWAGLLPLEEPEDLGAIAAPAAAVTAAAVAAAASVARSHP